MPPGFSIEDFFEPNEGDQEAVRGSFTHRAAFLPPYIRILAGNMDREQRCNLSWYSRLLGRL